MGGRMAGRGALRVAMAWIAVAAVALPGLSRGQAPAASDPVPSGVEYALVLPLESPSYGRAADAVRAGFQAAAARASAKTAVVGHGEGDAAEAHARARATGARVIVGPLIRDDLKRVVAAAADWPDPPTLALNQLDDGAPLPLSFYTLALVIEADARAVARSARNAGAQTAGVVGSDVPLQKRFADAFTAEWLLLGGAPPVVLRFGRAPEMLALLRAELGKIPLDAIVLAVGGDDVALVKPFVGQTTAYASSQVNDRPPRETIRDLDDLRFVEVPWLALPEEPAYAGIPRPDYPNASLDRLYALGIDAFRAAQLLAEGGSGRAIEFDGATGRVVLDAATRQLVRTPVLMQFRAGEMVPAGSR